MKYASDFSNELEISLERYAEQKGFFRRLLWDPAPIRALRKITLVGQKFPSQFRECFKGNEPKPSEASYPVYQTAKKLADVLGLLNEANLPMNQRIDIDSSDFEDLFSAMRALNECGLLSQENLDAMILCSSPENTHFEIANHLCQLSTSDSKDTSSFVASGFMRLNKAAQTKISLSIEEIAIAAKEYARKHVQKGYTQLENNALSELSRMALRSGVRDLREKIKQVINSSADEDKYEVKIEIIKKYSLGNCMEMAEMALHYVLTHHPGIFVQVCMISNGDHWVLTLGENEADFICDPWSNEVYHFSERSNKLQNYEFHLKELSEETKLIQQDKLSEFESKLKENNVKFKKINGCYPSPDVIITYHEKGGNQKLLFSTSTYNNYVKPLSGNQYLMPDKAFNSLFLYNEGATYRRAKVKEVLDFLEPFQETIASQTGNLNKLLSKHFLLKDNCLQASLSETEISTRKAIISLGLKELKTCSRYLDYVELAQKELRFRIELFSTLKKLNKEELIKKIKLFEKFYPIAAQQEKINDAIDCLTQLQDSYFTAHSSDKNSALIKPSLLINPEVSSPSEYHTDEDQQTTNQLINGLKNIFNNYTGRSISAKNEPSNSHFFSPNKKEYIEQSVKLKIKDSADTVKI